jgi:AraC-like DNA-binding protein
MSAATLRACASALANAGVSVEAHLIKLGLTSNASCNDEVRVPNLDGFALFERFAEMSGDPAFGLHAGANLPVGAMCVLDYLTRASGTIGEGLARMVRHYALIIEPVDLSIESTGHIATITRRFPPTFPQSAEMLFAAIIARGRTLSGSEWPLTQVSFAHARPADTRALESFFHAPLYFGRPVNEIVFDRAFLDAPLLTADPSLAALLDGYAELLQSRVSTADSLVRQLRGLLSSALPAGDAMLKSVAKRLGLSPRGLQRRLAERGTSYAALVDDLRRELALRYVSEPDRGLSEIAASLGFSEGSAFHRAFRRWTGMTPRQYRLH